MARAGDQVHIMAGNHNDDLYLLTPACFPDMCMFRAVRRQVEKNRLQEIVGLCHILRHCGHVRLMGAENSL